MFDMPSIKGDKKQLRALMSREATEIVSSKYTVVREDAQMRELVDLAQASGTIAFDTETRGLFRADKVVAMSIAVDDRAWLIPTRMVYAMRNFETHEVREHLNDLLVDPRVNKIMHNGKFDRGHMFREYDIDIKGVAHDTMIAQWVLNENEPHDLGSICEKYLNIPNWKIKQDGKFDCYPMKVATNYACSDALNLIALTHFQKTHFDRLPILRKLFYDVEMPYLDIVYRMEQRGIEWDEAYYQETMRPFVEGNREKYAQECYAVLGNINLASPDQVSAALFDGLRLPRIDGNSVNVRVLTQLKKYHPVIASLEQFRKFDTLYKLYVKKLPNFIEANRIHTTIKTIGTVTGRSAAADPNMQQLPKRSIGPLIRRAFVPSKDHVLIAMDYSQIELRIIAHLSQDPKMMAAFFSGHDFHSLTAHNMFGISMAAMDPKQGGDKDLPQRITGKTINFGIPYGMGGAKLMDTVNGELQKLPGPVDLMTLNKATDALDLYFATYPGVKRWLDKQKAIADKFGYVETILGRKRRLPGIKSDDRAIVAACGRQAGNAPIQGSAADIFKLASLAMDRVIRENRWPFHVLLAVHDEWLGEVPIEWLKHHRGALDVLTNTMRNAYPLTVPLEVSVDILSRWGDKVDDDALDISIEDLEVA